MDITYGSEMQRGFRKQVAKRPNAGNAMKVIECIARDLCRQGRLRYTRAMASVPLVPPKPKELDKASLIDMSRA